VSTQVVRIGVVFISGFEEYQSKHNRQKYGDSETSNQGWLVAIGIEKFSVHQPPKLHGEISTHIHNRFAREVRAMVQSLFINHLILFWLARRAHRPVRQFGVDFGGLQHFF
jgi:hypothetical protein